MQDSYSYVRSTAPAVAYDSKQYYQQSAATPAVAAAAAAQPQPTVAESYYQTGMPWFLCVFTVNLISKNKWIKWVVKFLGTFFILLNT